MEYVMVISPDYHKIITFVIPTLNRVHTTRRCIDRIQKLVSDCEVRIILSYSGSSDGTAELDIVYDNLKIVKNSPDVWWTGSIYNALKLINYKTVVCVLNDDVDLIKFDTRNLSVDGMAVYCGEQVQLNGEVLYGLKIHGLGLLRKASKYEIEVTNGSFFWFSSDICGLVLRSLKIEQAPHVGGDLILFSELKRLGCKLVWSDRAVIYQTNVTNYTRRVPIKQFWKHPASPYNVKMRYALARSLVVHSGYLGVLSQTLIYILDLTKYFLKKMQRSSN